MRSGAHAQKGRGVSWAVGASLLPRAHLDVGCRCMVQERFSGTRVQFRASSNRRYLRRLNRRRSAVLAACGEHVPSGSQCETLAREETRREAHEVTVTRLPLHCFAPKT